MTDTPLKERKRDRMKRYAKKAVTVPLSVRTGDLPKRAASAVVMLAVAGGALWAGGWWWDGLVVLVALVCLWEIQRLVWLATVKRPSRVQAMMFAMIYVGIAGTTLVLIDDRSGLLLILLSVVAVDTFAYFFGRAIGGPKIAPRISPSKTWAGLLGGSVGAFTCITCWAALTGLVPNVEFTHVIRWVGIGVLIAVVAQAGDFLESWLKRKAGQKDSSDLIPGHGGVFDRVDGHLAVCVLAFPMAMMST